MAARATHGTLTAGTAATVTLTSPWRAVLIANRSTTDFIFVRTDGIAATVGGDECDVVLPNSVAAFSVRAAAGYDPGQPGSTPQTNTVVSLISAGTPPYSVAGN